MKKYLLSLVLMTLACVSLVPQAFAEDEPPRLVSTSAMGEVEAIPDIAIVEGQVLEERADADDAVRATQKNLDRVIGYLKQQGIATEDIRAAQVLVNPKWHYPRNQPRQLSGYEARAEFTVKLRDVEVLARLYGGLIDSGANELQPTRFDFSNRDELELQAIAAAVKQARARAVAALAPLGAKVGEIHTLGIDTQWQQPPILRRESAAAMNMAAADGAPQINIGNHTVAANVSAAFKID